MNKIYGRGRPQIMEPSTRCCGELDHKRFEIIATLLYDTQPRHSLEHCTGIN